MGINGTLQLAGYASSTVALILSVAACGKFCGKITKALSFYSADKKWRISDYSENVVESQRQFSGLWTKCVQMGTGLESCDDYDHVLIGK